MIYLTITDQSSLYNWAPSLLATFEFFFFFKSTLSHLYLFYSFFLVAIVFVYHFNPYYFVYTECCISAMFSNTYELYIYIYCISLIMFVKDEYRWSLQFCAKLSSRSLCVFSTARVLKYILYARHFNSGSFFTWDYVWCKYSNKKCSRCVTLINAV